MEIGDRIKSLRKKNKLTQTEMGALLGKNRATVSLIESNVNAPTIDTVRILAEVLGVSTDYLICGEDNNTALRDDEKTFLDIYNRLDSDYKAVAKYKVKELYKEQEGEKQNR